MIEKIYVQDPKQEQEIVDALKEEFPDASEDQIRKILFEWDLENMNGSKVN